MAIGYVTGQSGGGLEINGVIREYTARADNISAGDFVQYINEGYKVDSRATIVTDSYRAGYEMNATKLSETLVLIVYMTQTSGASTKQLYAIACRIDGTTITAGVPSQLSSDYSMAIPCPALSALSGTRAITAFPQTDANSYAYYVLLNVDSNLGVAVFGGYINGTPTRYNGHTCSIVALTATKVVAFYTGASSETATYQWLVMKVGNISGNTISWGTQVAVRNCGTGDIRANPVRVNDTRFFVEFIWDAQGTYGALVCDVSGTTMTYHPGQRMLSLAYSGYYVAPGKMRINESGTPATRNRIAYAHGNEGVVSAKSVCLSVHATGESGTSWSNWTPTIVLTDAYAQRCGVCWIDQNRLLVLAFSSANYYSEDAGEITNKDVVGVIVTIDGNAFTVSPKFVAIKGEVNGGTTYYVPCIDFDDGHVFISDARTKSTNNDLDAVLSIPTESGIYPYRDKIAGVAASNADAGDTIKVYVPAI